MRIAGPLPTRDGVGASCVALPSGNWDTITDFLVARFPAQSRAVWLHRMERAEVMDEFGVPVTAQRPYAAQLRVYYYRTLDAEPSIPFDAPILHRDEHLLVVDKPHFLPVVPSGRYLQETVLVRLKRALGVDHIVPIHRIDRDTAGVVLFSLQPHTRDSYHALFRRRLVHKVYEAVAPVHTALQFPLTRSSRIAASGHFMQQCEVSGAPNAITQIEMIRRHGAMAHYRLRPLTGQRHQLRVHMAALGIPIVWDGLYPQLTPERQPDYGQPLQLLARSIEFSDPLSGSVRRFESRRALKLVESDAAL